MKQFTIPIQENDVISRGIDAEAIDIAFALAASSYAINKQLEEDVVLLEFPKLEAAENFTDKAIDYINRCTDHNAEVADQLCRAKSNEWNVYPVGVYLPTIEIRFENGRQVEGLLLTDLNGKPFGVIVIDCDDNEAHLLETVIRF